MKMNKIYLEGVVLLAIVCTIAFLVFIFLNMGEEFSPGWTDPVKVDESGGALSLLHHNGELWAAFNRRGDEGTEIAVIHSKDGIEWSNSSTLVKKTAEYLISPKHPQWLERPDGDIWVLWRSGKGTSDDYLEIVHYAIWKEDGTFTAPGAVHSYDGNTYSFSSVTNTPGGGLTMLEHYYPPVYAIIQGREVRGTVYTRCVVQSTDDHSEWSQPFLLSKTDFASCATVLLDDQGVIWAVYEESDPVEGTYFRTSHDGITWSESHMVPVRFPMRFLQRRNHQYVLFFIYDSTAVYMMSSPDGIEWSSPTLVAHLDKAYDMDAAESEDGILWVMIDGGSCFYVTQYSDQQYSQDSQIIQNFRTRNGILACGIAATAGAFWILLRRKFFRW
jgi:hypothetical protein